MSDTSGHVSVLLQEVIEGLAIQEGHWYVDVTFGRGGHTKGILEKGGKVIAFDQDEEAIRYGQKAFVRELEQKKIILVKRNFEFLREEIEKLGEDVQGDTYGVLADFGVSSTQLDEGDRGFSFQHDAPLDMRMNKELSVSAKDLVNGLGKRELYELLTQYAQEQHARVIVDVILDSRKHKPIETTGELASLIEKKIGRSGHLHPATKTFLALRMLVNDEAGVIERMLPQAMEILQRGGRLVTISFHEGEDRIVKKFMRDEENEGNGVGITKKPLEASNEERQINMRSRSAKLRIFEKTL